MAKKGSAVEIVRYKKTGGPITIEVTSGYSSLGSFVLAYAKKGDAEFKEFGKDPKRIDDEIADIFVIPLDLEKLEEYRVIILGKYQPAPGHNQIKVEYTFIQDNKVIHKSVIEKPSEEAFERFTNRYEFLGE